MTDILLALLIWLWVASELLRFRPIRSRQDLWPLVLLWPLAFALVAGILAYELIYRAACWVLRRGRTVQP